MSSAPASRFEARIHARRSCPAAGAICAIALSTSLMPGAAGGGPVCARRRATVSREPLVAHRLQKVVDGGALERLDRVLVERGHEHDAHVAVRAARHVESGQARHADVEERDVRRLGGEQRLRLRAVVRDPRDDELGPQRGEAVPEVVRETRLVVGDDRA